MTDTSPNHPTNANTAQQNSDFKCRVCGATDAEEWFNVKECDLGIGTMHKYSRCAHCSSISILEVPQNLADYYVSEDYYSFQEEGADELYVQVAWKTKLLSLAMFNRGIVGKGLAYLFSQIPSLKHLHDKITEVRACGINSTAAVLDVGCGQKTQFDPLRNTGFAKIDGCDPFAAKTIERSYGTIWRSDLADLPASNKYDLILFSHSLEHMPDPIVNLRAAKDRLAPEGTILLQIPTGEGQEMQVYRENCVLFEAPRHIFIPSDKGVRTLLQQAGLKIERTTWNQSISSLLRSEFTKVTKGQKALSKHSYRDMQEHIGSGRVAELEELAKQLSGVEKKTALATYIIKPA